MSFHLVTLWTKNISWFSLPSCETKKRYSIKHGYEYLEYTDLIDKSRSASWNKIAIAKKLVTDNIDKDKWFWITDADLFILNKEIKIEDFIDNSYDLIISSGPSNILESGSFLIKSTHWSKDFLNRVWDNCLPNEKFSNSHEKKSMTRVAISDFSKGHILWKNRGDFHNIGSDFQTYNNDLVFTLHFSGLRSNLDILKLGMIKMKEHGIISSIPDIKETRLIKKKHPFVQVCSWPRSGTHFLMASLWLNFEFHRDLSREEKSGGHFGTIPVNPSILKYTSIKGESNICPWSKLFAGHSKFEDLKTTGINLDELIYIYRNPIDSVKSMMTATDQILTKEELDKNYQLWKDHVNGYLSAGVFSIKYEDMISDFNSVMERIKDTFQLERKTDKYIRPPSVGWTRK